MQEFGIGQGGQGGQGGAPPALPSGSQPAAKAKREPKPKSLKKELGSKIQTTGTKLTDLKALQNRVTQSSLLLACIQKFLFYWVLVSTKGL